MQVESSATHQSAGAAVSEPALRLAYLTTEYPAVSHTFIRREILELERRGHSVLRLSVRASKPDLPDAADRAEVERTLYVLAQGLPRLVGAAVEVMLTRPGRAFRALAMARRMSAASDRGMVRHLAYFVEACYLLGVLQRERIEHVHVHFGTNPAAVARLIRCLGGPGYSMTVHGPDEFDAPGALSLGEKIADSKFTVAISSFGRAQLQRWAAPEHWSKIQVVHCTVDQAFAGDAEPISEDNRTFVCVGRLAPQKGQLVAVNAMAQLRDQGVDAQLVLVGDGEMRSVIEQAIARHDLSDRVTITGWASGAEVRAHLEGARAMVLPSFAEGLPVVIMEAMALGRPVISTYVAGIPELVRPGENGWLVPAGDPAALADAMKDALSTTHTTLTAMGAAAVTAVRQGHSVETEVAQLEQHFTHTIAAKASR